MLHVNDGVAEFANAAADILDAFGHGSRAARIAAQIGHRNRPARPCVRNRAENCCVG